MDANHLYVLCGLNRLTVAVARGLVRDDPGAEVVVVAPEPDPVYGPLAQRHARIVYAHDGLEAALRDQARVAGAACLLALSEQDLDNMRAAVVCHSLAPSVPMVVRVFDKLLAQQLEGLRSAGDGQGLNIRRAYSLSALAAPRFVAAALGEEHLLTMRLAGHEIPFFRLTVHGSSHLAGRPVADAAREVQCTVVAYQPQGGAWQAAFDDQTVLRAGDGVVVAGPDEPVLRLAARNSELFGTGTGTGAGPAPARPSRRGARRQRDVPTLLPKLALILSLVLVASLFVIGLTWRRNPVDALYWTLTAAASGAPSDPLPVPTGLKLFAVIPIMAGGALLGVLFSHLASVATAQRLEQRLDRRVARMRNHVVLGGLGTIGFRIERLLGDLGIPTVVIELSPQDKFATATRAPVFPGDIRLPENLARANIAHAACLIAVTDDDLANLEASLNARHLNPRIHTVVRIFDDTLADQSQVAFGISRCFSASRVAARAFVDAATDQRALRQFAIGSDAYLGLRLVVSAALDRRQLEDWRAQGVTVVAVRRAGEPDLVHASPAVPHQLGPGDEAVVVGPAQLVRRLAETGQVAPSR